MTQQEKQKQTEIATRYIDRGSRANIYQTWDEDKKSQSDGLIRLLSEI